MRIAVILLAILLAGAACLDQPPRPGPGPDPQVDAFVPLPDGGSGSGFDAAIADLEHSGSSGIAAGAGDLLDRRKPDALVNPHRRAARLGDDHQLLDHR